MPRKSKTKSSKRLTREQWLDKALNILAREGKAKLRIERLARDMKVTRGSFYWHFRDRRDFVKSVVEYWVEKYTSIVRSEVAGLQIDAKSRLLALMEKLVYNRHERYDIAIRAWAALDADVARIVRKADRMRMDFVRSLFTEMGFTGKELEMRVRTFVVFHSLELGIFVRLNRQERMKLVKLRHAFFTRP